MIGMKKSPLLAAAALLLSLVLAGPAQAAGGTAVGWGDNSYGQLTGPESSESPPVPANGLSEAAQLAAGGYHSLAVMTDGTVRAWGFNYEGQLGIGDPTGPEMCTPTYTCSTKVLTVPGLSGAVAVAAGTYHSLALLANGTVMAWGENSEGQLGIGNDTGPEICHAYPCSTKPLLVPGLSNVVAIAAGANESLALLADGTVMAWGDDENGQGGSGPSSNSCKCIDHPVQVPGLSNAVAIAAGEFGGSALLADGTVMDWGANEYGQLGNGTVTEGMTCNCLGPVAVSGLAGARTTSVGSYHRLAALGAGGAAAWGENSFGELGTGTKTTTGCECSSVATPVSGVASAQAVEADLAFGVALLADGTVSSWGYGGEGQLGEGGATFERSSPAPVPGVTGASEVSSGEIDVLALIGPSQTLNVAFAGAGSGTVGTDGIVCPASNCTARYPQGQVEILRASPTSGGFAGFSGPCTGTGACRVAMSGDQTVTATFGVPKGTAITKALIKSKKGRAKFAFTAPGAITGYECKLKRRKPKNRNGGKKPKPAKFSRCRSPRKYKNLKPGTYTFKVRALDILGADAKPAVKKFTIKKPRPRHKRR
jgi:alpha-tubulin suppressor-like RCC1 family protein